MESCIGTVETLMKADMLDESQLTFVCSFKAPSSFTEVGTDSTILYR